MRIIPLMTAVLLATSHLVNAQSLTVPTVVFSGAATADWATTLRADGLGAREANPLIGWLDHHAPAQVATGAAIDVAGVFLWNRYVGRHHPKIAATGLYLAGGFRVWLAAQNYIKNPSRMNLQLCRAPIPMANPAYCQ